MTVAYDGTRYAGWQRQTSTKQKPTIQETLERVLRQILQEPVKVIGSGRTDAGVHAEAQIAHIRTRSALPFQRLLSSINQLLPPDIAVLRVNAVREPFHARFDASEKHYRYRLFTGLVVPPFIRSYVHHVRTPLNVSLLRREAAALKGRHSFRAFVRASSIRGSTTRTIRQVALRCYGDELRVDITGDGFLHTMVRSIVGTLLDIGRGRLPVGTMHRMLTTGDRRLAGSTAPAKGLTLVGVTYRRRHG